MELCKVKNKGKTPLILRHDAHGNVTIAPGKDRIVPLDHIVVNFGNPGARNEGKNKVRDADYASLLTRWGFYPGIHADAEWDDMKPKFEVYDLDDNRVYTIIEDPTGELAATSSTEFVLSEESRDNAFLNKRIEALEAQLAQAIALMGQNTAAPVPTNGPTESAPEADQPTTPHPGESQEERNEQRDDIPAPKAADVSKDKPATTRVGSKG